MSFNIALSGLAAAQKDLDTTANNIANVNTTGFKESRAEFADVYATSLFSSGKTKVGDGVTTAVVAQQFSQGALQFTNNALDLAITGEGFFAMSADRMSQDLSYTRGGAFKLNAENYIVDSRGNYLQGYAVDVNTGEPTSVSLGTARPIAIPTSAGAPRATSEVYLTFNLDSAKQEPVTAFDPTDATSYNHKVDVPIYDSLGAAHLVTVYLRRETTVPPANSEWTAYATFDDDTTAFGPQSLNFDSSGNAVLPVAPLTLDQATLNGLLNNGAQYTSDLVVRFQDPATLTTPTQYSAKFETFTINQNGTTVGTLTGIDIDAAGKVMASYSNGDQNYLAQVSIVRFANNQGLKQVGNTSWKQTITSGEAIAGNANSGTFGAINASALEQSNVNLTTELVDLISAQRN
jgi:flagellar hook protein FlgE